MLDYYMFGFSHVCLKCSGHFFRKILEALEQPEPIEKEKSIEIVYFRPRKACH